MHVLVDQAAGLGRGGAHDALDHVGGQLLQHVHRVVHVQLFHDAGQLRVRDGVDDALLLGRFKVGKNVSRRVLGEQTEDHGHAVVLQLREELGQVVFVHVLHAPLQLLHVSAVQQLHQLIAALFLNGFIVEGFQVLVFLQQGHLPMLQHYCSV